MDKLAVLEDERDKRYVIDKEKEYREMFQRLSAQIGANDQGSGQAARMRPEDRMRFALAFFEEHVYELYLTSQDCLTHSEIDAGESGAGGGFWSVFLDTVNEPEWEPETEAVPNLHSAFAE